jgi:serine/threonine protein phosphatase 1
MQRIFFIGDIHGCSKTFRKIVSDEIVIRKSDLIICIGDYIDRGKDSKGVVDFILELREEQFRVITLRGNHEQMLIDSMDSDHDLALWLMNGGGATLESFNVPSVDQLDHVYLEFFRETEYFIMEADFIAVHAGLNFTINDPLSDRDSMLWIRNFTPDQFFLNGRLLVHGHSPMDRQKILSQKFEGAVNIDGGCVYKTHRGLGSLFALDFHGQQLIEVKNID